MAKHDDEGAPRAGSGRSALLLVNLGTPAAPTAAAVRRYLAQFLHDHRVVDVSRWLWCAALHGIILPLRSPKVARNYARIWMPEGSPLLVHSQRLADALQHQLPDVDVRLGMTYGEPSIPSVLRDLRGRGMTRLLVLPLYPQYSATTTAAVFDAVDAELGRWRRRPSLRTIDDYHRDAGWLDALEARVRAHWDLHGRGQRLLLSYHGIPERYVRLGDPYPLQCQAGAEALAQRLGLSADDWQLCYQSRFGREPWLGPATDTTLQELARNGIRDVDLLCPGFAVDCLETLEEIAVQNAEAFHAAGGGQLRYISALNDTPGHVAALAALARRHLQGWEGGA
ncbi:MAG TPA: ferrochelatase [Arenimonas sp.]|nr:ferrochelatase [Arenimonas sp.]